MTATKVKVKKGKVEATAYTRGLNFFINVKEKGAVIAQRTVPRNAGDTFSKERLANIIANVKRLSC
jgi:hypothetical protein